jgi:hypothetical protein
LRNFYKKTTFIFCFLFLIIVGPANSSEALLANITTDVLSDYYQLKANVNNDNENLAIFYFDTYTNNTFEKRDEITIDDFIKKGIRVPSTGKVVVVQITGENFDEEQGGMLTLNTLVNILTGTRKIYELHLAIAKHQWALYKDGKIVTQIKVKANRIPMLGVVGIKNLIMEE